MRSNLLSCARLGVLAMLTAACGGQVAVQSHDKVPVTIRAACSGSQVRLVVEPSAAHFKHTGWSWNLHHQGPTDVAWALDTASTPDSVTIAADAAWPFDSATTFSVGKGTPRTRLGKDTQDKGHYRYTVTVACPNGGPTAIFDPDVWVD